MPIGEKTKPKLQCKVFWDLPKWQSMIVIQPIRFHALVFMNMLTNAFAQTA